MAKLGCSKCLKRFSGSVGCMNYGGFDQSHRPRRNNRRSVQNVQQSNTQHELSTLESAEGCRYSCLLKLPYFDAPRMLSIDPMHNLFLGSGKHDASLA